jgi:hypothetical protein
MKKNVAAQSIDTILMRPIILFRGVIMNSEKCIIETRVGANPDIPSSINLFIM